MYLELVALSNAAYSFSILKRSLGFKPFKLFPYLFLTNLVKFFLYSLGETIERFFSKPASPSFGEGFIPFLLDFSINCSLASLVKTREVQSSISLTNSCPAIRWAIARNPSPSLLKTCLVKATASAPTISIAACSPSTARLSICPKASS